MKVLYAVEFLKITSFRLSIDIARTYPNLSTTFNSLVVLQIFSSKGLEKAGIVKWRFISIFAQISSKQNAFPNRASFSCVFKLAQNSIYCVQLVAIQNHRQASKGEHPDISDTPNQWKCECDHQPDLNGQC